MKKIKDKKFEEKLSQDLEQYYNSIEVPELSDDKKAQLLKHIEQNTPRRKKITLWRKITAVASTVCLIALIIIPTVIMLNKNNTPKNPPAPPPIYYGKEEALKEPHDLLKTQEIVNTCFPKYNFMFTDLIFESAKGFYASETNTLLAIQIKFNEKEIPLQVEIHIIASEFFTFDDTTSYTTQAEHTTTENYEMYKITYQDGFTEYQRGYIIYEDHEIYINFKRVNENLFNKFI